MALMSPTLSGYCELLGRQSMANILFVHNNFPAQFGFIAEALVSEGHRCVAIASKTGRAIDGVRLLRWVTRRGHTAGLGREVHRIEADLIRGAAAAKAALALREEGFVPDIIVGHPGWGETIYLREIFPSARQIVYAEYYYRSEGGDVGFDPEFGPSPREPYKINAKNGGMALAFAEADVIVAPTPFQQSLLPDAFRERSRVIHEGVDLSKVRRRSSKSLSLPSGRVLEGSRPIITFINRKLEPLRGYHIFMRALPRLMAQVPEAEVLIVGADQTGGYGMQAPPGVTWGRHILREVASEIDSTRLHFVGHVPHEVMLTALSLSAVHVYFTYPFVLSWSLLEAMACEALVIASDTAPVRDVIVSGRNGILVDFFDASGLASQMVAACRSPARFLSLRQLARQTVELHYDRQSVCLPAWRKLVGELLRKRQ